MPHRGWTFRVQDILDAIAAIRAYTETMEFSHFVADRRTVDAVIRNLTVIGEAAARVPDEICSITPDIPWEDMRAMRNFVVHEYFGVNDTILWDTVRRDLPDLEEPLTRLLQSGRR
ncbi:MAG: HepT-like ribonuclease domain-containing protein [Desulfobacteria bacterium]